MGFFTIGLGITLITAGTAYMPAAEVSLLVLIESVLGPIWPWIFLDEHKTFCEIIDGGIALLAVIAFTCFGQNKINQNRMRL